MIDLSTDFASDNHAGAHPTVLAAVAAANTGTAHAYGADPWTRDFEVLVKERFGDEAAGFAVLSGTGANVLSLSLMLADRYAAVICPDSAHIATNEAGATDRLTGTKLILAPTSDGKLTPDDITARIPSPGSFHSAQPRVVSISQVTEVGTCYTPAEVAALAERAHGHGLLLHMDGARIANAAAHLGCSLREFTTDAGVDVLSFGGTKNGALFAEAVVVLTPGLAEKMPFLRCQTLQQASKMRFISAQLSALFTDDLWRRNAAHANVMADRLAEGVRGLPGLTIRWPVQSNAVFAALPQTAIETLRARYTFHTWHEPTGTVRWMTSFATTPESIDAFVSDIKATLKPE
jgi:threonine aldolase